MRLEITRRTDLAIRAIRRMHGRGTRMKRPQLAEEIGTTADFLVQVMAPLVRLGWVDSAPGRNGGYSLAIDPVDLSVLEVIGAVEAIPTGSVCVLRGGPCGDQDACALHDAWLPARDRLLEQLGTTPVLFDERGDHHG